MHARQQKGILRFEGYGRLEGQQKGEMRKDSCWEG